MQRISISALLGEEYKDLTDEELIEKLVLEILRLRDKKVPPSNVLPWHPPGVRGPLKEPSHDEWMRPRLVE